WLPTFFKETYGMDIMSSGLFTAVPWLISTVSGIVVGGWLVDFLIQKGHSNTKVYQTIIVIGMSLGFAFLGAVFTHNITIAIICISVGLAGISATAPIGWSISADIAPVGSISLLSSMVNLANNLFGGIIAVSLTGYLVDVTGSFTLSFLVAGFVLLLGLVFYLAVLGDIKRIRIGKQKT
ncbi:MFS transporter, partial [Bacillus licheniformis]